MKVLNHRKFAMCDYNQTVCDNPFELGDIVKNEYDEIGVVIQIHDKNELRTHQFGNVSTSEVKMASMDEFINIESIVDNLDIESDLFNNYEKLPKDVVKILDKYSEYHNTYETLNQLSAELYPLGYEFSYGLDAEPYDLRKII